MDYLITKDDVTYRCTSDILEHHGIKGQKWGIRRYQNPDGSLTPAGKIRYRYAQGFQKTANKNAEKAKSRESIYSKARTIPAGVKMYRTSTSPIEYEAWPGAIKNVTYLEPDRNLYKGGKVRQTRNTKGAFEYTYELTKDLKIPSRKEQREVINTIVFSNSKLLNEAIRGWYNTYFPKGSDSRLKLETETGMPIKTFVDKTIKEFGDLPPGESAFYVTQSFGLADNVKIKVISELARRGYNAMADEGSIGGRYGSRKEGYDPLIIFDDRVLKDLGITDITPDQEREAHDKYTKWKNKANSTDAKWSDI